MKEKVLKIWSNKKLRYIVIAVVVIILVVIVKSGGSAVNISYDTVVKQDLLKTVKASGQVTSVVDLNLSFKKSDNVSSVKVKVGDKVKRGQVLAVLTNQAELGALTTARGQLLSAKAKYKKLLEVNNNDLRSAQIDVDNAYRQMLSDGLVALPEDYTTTNSNPIITGIYNGDKIGKYYINHYRTISGFAFNLTSHKDDAIASSGSGRGSTTKPTPLGNEGLYILYEEDWDDSPSTETYIVEIPNTKSASYVINFNNYQTALQNLEIAKQNSNIENADIDQANADILQAEGAVQIAQGNYDATVITAPIDGTITKVDIKTGELATALDPVVVVQDVGNLYVEANINEANITNLSIGLPVEYTIDAFGRNQKFTGIVASIDQSATVKDGIVNYKVRSSLDELECNDTAICANISDLVKSGMNANLTILINKISNTLVLPEVAIVNHDNKNFVNIVTNEKRGKYEEVEVTTGSVGDGNLVEITGGIKEGDRIAIIAK